MANSLILEWDLDELAAAMHLEKDEVLVYFRDGRRISFILERRIRDAFPSWKLAPSEGSGFDLIDDKGGRWEARSISSGIYFCPSYMVGSGRVFEEQGFLQKLENIEGYVCSDIKKFPQVPVFVVPSDLIFDLYRKGQLGAGTRISSARFYSTIVPLLSSVVIDD
ncbi:hypothetical protein [Erythrobacter cryptus]|uniref:hypothetical protein n=1 Tax=Erythrobacter cryptus TaxID=196588 RepID=UPI0004853C27|nr:hypothetical protein [Erythrobacter cryptus]